MAGVYAIAKNAIMMYNDYNQKILPKRSLLIYYRFRKFDFDGLKLQTAIRETLQNRGTAYEKDRFDRILALAEDDGMQTKWRYFLKTLGNPKIEFAGVVAGIERFLQPVWGAILSEKRIYLLLDSAEHKMVIKRKRG